MAYTYKCSACQEPLDDKAMRCPGCTTKSTPKTDKGFLGHWKGPFIGAMKLGAFGWICWMGYVALSHEYQMRRPAAGGSSALVLASSQAHASEFGPFSQEIVRFKAEFPCPQAKVTPAYSSSSGALFGCIAGTAQTVKFFVNQKAGTDAVQNIKVVWNDWFEDRGHGLHADRKEAGAMVSALARLYAPSKQADLLLVFRSTTNQTINANGYSFAFTYHHGPAIDERMFVITKL